MRPGRIARKCPGGGQCEPGGQIVGALKEIADGRTVVVAADVPARFYFSCRIRN
jgi:hypothetical protein